MPDNPDATSQTAPEEAEDQDIDLTPVNTPYGLVKPAPIVQEMQRSYLDYAMSVIVSRALPDVRDGLKPVHRRILYAMKDMGLTHTSTYKKSARIVGEVLGKYHPHGDSAVYDALVRLAQEFSMRYPLIKGQGNFGSIDGDSPAAMRYTEAKLNKITGQLLADIDKNTVDFADNFDGSVKEPLVLPSNLPNLLLMGSEGIAVGMATKIPPHNLVEVVNAVNTLIDKGQSVQAKDTKPIKKDDNLAKVDPNQLTGKFTSEATIDNLIEHVTGPDFPTSGTIFDWSQIKEVYLNGKGKIIIRGKAEIEEGRAGKMRIVISELPYQVNKAKLVTKIANHVKNKRLVGISDIRDESDRQGLSVVIELKRDARPKSILNNLYKLTELQTSFPANLVALNSEGTPQLMNLKTILLEYVRHRQLVVTRRSQYELLAAQERAHILEGLLIALNNLDEVIATIRSSKDVDIARAALMKKFKLSELQATAILDMQLRRLAALERQKIEDEYEAIKAKIDFLTNLLMHPEQLLALIKEELNAAKDTFGDERKTLVIKHGVGDFSEEDLVPKEDVIVTLTQSGYIKRMPPSTYRSQHRGGKGVSGMRTKQDDTVSHILSANTHDNLLIFTNKGKVFKLKVFELPQGTRQAKGQAIINLIPIEQDETIQNIIPASSKLKDIQDKYITLATKKGIVKKTAVSLFQNIRSTGIIAIILQDDDQLVWGDITTGDKDILMVTYQGKSIRFKEAQIKSTARDTKGVMGIRLGKEDYVVAVESIENNLKKPVDRRKKFINDLLVITEQGMGKRTPFTEYPVQNRGGQGVKVMNLSKKTGNLAAALAVDQNIDQIIITTKAGQIVKLPLHGIPQLTRPTQGVILMRFAKTGDSAVAAAAIQKETE